MRHHALYSFGLAILISFITISSSLANKRYAFVVGNDDYENVSKLEKAVNDADSLASALTGIGYSVILKKNLNRRDFNMNLQKFFSQLKSGDEALFFFAGHGVEIRGQNYLLPTDIPNAEPGQEAFVKGEAIGVNQVLQEIGRRKVRLSILILDACRNNPFKVAGKRSLGRTRGLGTMEAPPEGTFILYSAGFGQAALDRLSDNDPHPNSVFTRSLVPMLKKPGLKLSDAARDLRRQVMELASTVSHQQRPAYYDEVLGDFYFTPPLAGNSEIAAAPKPIVQPQAIPGVGGTCGIWPQIATTATYAQVEAFLAECQAGIYSKLAKARLTELKKVGGNQLALLPPPVVQDQKDPEDGDKEALFNRGWNLYNGKNGEQRDYGAAARLYRKAADLGHYSAMVNLGYCYENGHGVPKNYFEAVKLYKVAANNNETQGMTNLGYMYESGQGIEKSLPEAVKWYKKAAENGSLNGMANLGYMYEQGRGTKADFKEAVKWYRKGADGGSARAQNNLAYMYLNGRGVAKSDKKALKYYKLAADQSFGNAFYMLGYMNVLGKGLKKNSKKAADWVFKALKARHQFAVKEMTTNPDGWNAVFRRELQRLMAKDGVYNGPIDGKFGPTTFSAVRTLGGA